VTKRFFSLGHRSVTADGRNFGFFPPTLV
jgi:hypothetical protein